jgi:hypothetical protein
MTRNCWKNLGATILAHAVPHGNSEIAAFGSGNYDGARRNHFFQRIDTIWGDSMSPQPQVSVTECLLFFCRKARVNRLGGIRVDLQHRAMMVRKVAILVDAMIRHELDDLQNAA